MKLTPYIFTFIILLASLVSNAQILENLSVGIHTGISYTGLAFRSLKELKGNKSANARFDLDTRAPLSLSLDLKPNERFSIGLLFSNQNFSGFIEGYTFNYLDDSLVIEDVDLELKRYFIGITPKYYWKKGNGNIELYSSLRVGYALWRSDISTTDQSFELPEWLGFSRPSVGLVPIGGNLFITNQIALNFESAIAAPYVFRLGFQYSL